MSTLRKILFALFFVQLIQAANYQILPVEGSGIDAGLKQNIEALVRNAVIENGDKVVAGKAFVLKTNVMKLGKSYTVIVEKLEGDKSLSSAKLKASNEEELDIITQRTVNAVINNESSSSNDEIGKISDREETLVSKRKETRKYQTLGFGPAWAHGLGRDGFLYNFHGGRFWEVSPHWALSLLTESAFQFKTSGMTHLTGLLGGRFYITPTAISPFIGLAGGLGLAAGDDFFFGFATGASAGIVFFRTSGTQLELGTHYDIIFGTEDGSPAGKFATYLALNF